jgi:predicted nucleotidyltransferase
MALADTELLSSLRSLLAPLPSVLCAEIFGSFAAGTLREHSDIDLLIVVDVIDADALSKWNEIFPWDALCALEQELRREIQVIDNTLAHVSAEARRGGGFYTTIYAHPRLKLISSLEEILPPDADEALAAAALTFLEHCEQKGALQAASRPRLAELRARV